MATINREIIEQFGSLELIARQVVEGFIVGLHKSPFHGFSVEFAEHRQYNTGESTKHIDWKIYGRTDKLFVKKYEEETNLRCQILLDISPSMYFPVRKSVSIEEPSKLTFSIYCAAAILNLLIKQRDAAGLTLFDQQIQQHTANKSTSVHQKYLFSLLEEQLHSGKKAELLQTSVANTIHEIAEKIHKRSLIIIFSDMFDNMATQDELFSALQHLKYNKHEVILFHVYDGIQELEFTFENRPHRFIDLETGKELKLNPTDLREKYLQKIRQFKKELKLRCGQYSIDYVETDINKPFKEVLLPYLTKRNKLL